MIYQYKYKFYLNASHSIKINNSFGQIHSHCFEIAIDIASTSDTAFTSFNEIEDRIEKLLDSYQDKLLNEIPPFNVINPTIENICGYFKCIIASNLAEIGWVILTIEMSETPSRAYIINVIEEMEDIFEDSELPDIEDDKLIDDLSDEILTKIGIKPLEEYNQEIEEDSSDNDKYYKWDVDVPDGDDFDIKSPENMEWDINISEGDNFDKTY